MSDDKSESMFESVVAAFKQRLSHPVAGVFVIAWLICNWRFLFYIAVANDAAPTRIFKSTLYWDFGTLVWFPAVATALFLILAPLATAGVSRWNDWVTGKEADRIYNDQLVTLERENYLANKRLHALAPALKSQQEAKVTLEATIRQLEEKRESLRQAIVEITDVSSTDWEKFHKAQEHLVKVGRSAVVHDNVNRVIFQLNKIEELKSELKKQHPTIAWDKLLKGPS